MLLPLPLSYSHDSFKLVPPIPLGNLNHVISLLLPRLYSRRFHRSDYSWKAHRMYLSQSADRVRLGNLV